MPTVQAIDNFSHGDFTVPGGANYSAVLGTPVKDTTVVHAPDPASMRIQVTAADELVTNTITGSPPLGWHGFWWRIDSDPATDIDISQMTPAAGNQARLAYSPSNNFIYHFFPGGTTETEPFEPLGIWTWIEMIFDVSVNPHLVYTRFGGVDLAPAAQIAEAASTAASVNLGTNSSTTMDVRYSNHYWGTAASSTDWMGEPVGFQQRQAPQLVGRHVF